MRVKLVEEIATAIHSRGLFKLVYKNIVPNWTQVPAFPAIGIVYDSDISTSATTGSSITVEANIVILIYQHQSNDDYSDKLSSLVDEVEKIICSNKFVICSTINSGVSSFKRDGGILMPFSVAQLTLKVSYRKNCSV